MNWEYKSEVLDVEELNKLGEEGWEMVAAIPESIQASVAGVKTTSIRYTLKRALKEDTELLKG